MKTEQEIGLGQSQLQLVWHTLQQHPLGMVGFIGMMLIILLVLLAPWIAPYDPIESNYGVLLQPPSSKHWFGTDNLGRDLFSRILWGGRDSLLVGFIGMAIALTGGIIVGLVAGYYGALVDAIIMRFVDIWMAFPTLLLLLSIIAILGPGLTTLTIALGFASIPVYARVVRGSVLAVKNEQYVTAARVIGASDGQIMLWHIFPNIMGFLIIYATLELSVFILTAAGLSFLGLGAQPPSPEWGRMLNDGIAFIRQAWWMSAFPGLAIFLTSLFINMLGDGLRDALEPRLQSKKPTQ